MERDSLYVRSLRYGGGSTHEGCLRNAFTHSGDRLLQLQHIPLMEGGEGQKKRTGKRFCLKKRAFLLQGEKLLFDVSFVLIDLHFYLV